MNSGDGRKVAKQPRRDAFWSEGNFGACWPGISWWCVERGVPRADSGQENATPLRLLAGRGLTASRSVGALCRRTDLYLAVTHSGVTLASLIGQLAALEILDGATVDLLANYPSVAFHWCSTRKRVSRHLIFIGICRLINVNQSADVSIRGCFSSALARLQSGSH